MVLLHRQITQRLKGFVVRCDLSRITTHSCTWSITPSLAFHRAVRVRFVWSVSRPHGHGHCLIRPPSPLSTPDAFVQLHVRFANDPRPALTFVTCAMPKLTTIHPQLAVEDLPPRHSLSLFQRPPPLDHSQITAQFPPVSLRSVLTSAKRSAEASGCPNFADPAG